MVQMPTKKSSNTEQCFMYKNVKHFYKDRYNKLDKTVLVYNKTSGD